MPSRRDELVSPPSIFRRELLLTEAGAGAGRRCTSWKGRGAGGPRPRRTRATGRGRGRLHQAISERELHRSSGARRPPALQRDRERILRRDSAPGTLSSSAHVSPWRSKRLSDSTVPCATCSPSGHERFRRETGHGFPEKVTAFRRGWRCTAATANPAPVCGTPVQRIRYADNETNYCPICQTVGSPRRP